MESWGIQESLLTQLIKWQLYGPFTISHPTLEHCVTVNDPFGFLGNLDLQLGSRFTITRQHSHHLSWMTHLAFLDFLDLQLRSRIANTSQLAIHVMALHSPLLK